MLYRCIFCNTYEYDSIKGDLNLGIPPGTQPEEIPEEMKCPVCKVDKISELINDNIIETRKNAGFFN